MASALDTDPYREMEQFRLDNPGLLGRAFLEAWYDRPQKVYQYPPVHIMKTPVNVFIARLEKATRDSRINRGACLECGARKCEFHEVFRVAV